MIALGILAAVILLDKRSKTWDTMKIVHFNMTIVAIIGEY